MEQSLADRTINGFNWNFAGQAAGIFFSLTVGVVLARLLFPSDFGLLGMTTIFSGFAAQFASLGIGAALIQRRLLTEYHIRVAYTLSILLGLLMTLSLWSLAYPISLYFSEPRVLWVFRFISITFLINGFSIVSMSLLRRAFKFKVLFYIDFASLIFGYAAISIPMAFFNCGVWSLVAGTISQSAVSCVLLLYFQKPAKSLLLTRNHALDLLTFGTGVSVNGILNYLAANVDYLIIGRYLSANTLGLYTRAYTLMALPLNRFALTFSTVLFPAYSEIQHDSQRLAQAYLRAINAVSLITFPILTAFAIGADYIILGLYGENWAGCIGVFQILCLAGMLKSVCHLAGTITQATGNIFYEVKRQFIYLFLLTVGSLIAVHHGIEAVGIAVIFGSTWLYLSMAQIAIRILAETWTSFFRAQLPGLAIAAIVGAADLLFIFLMDFYLTNVPSLVKLFLFSSTSILSFFLSLVLLPEQIKGDIPKWFAARYSNFVPNPIRGWLLTRLNQK